MAITADEMALLMQEHSIQLRLRRDIEEWVAVTRDGGRLHRGSFPTPMEAVEAAVQTILAAKSKNIEADKARLFGLLASARYFVRPRVVALPDDPDTGLPGGTATVWDVFRLDNTRFVTAERSLTAAIIQAEIELQA
jgi:hypothetical protein